MTIVHSIISEDFHRLFFEQFLAELPQDFADRVRRFRRWQDAQAALLGRLLLIEVIGKGDRSILSRLEYTHYGRPYIQGLPDFNISHSGKHVLLACDPFSRIGIDIEETRPINHEDFRFQMTENEWIRIDTAPDRLAAFYTYWTQKEAVIKAHGNGLSLPLKSFELQDDQTQIGEEVFYVKRIEIASDAVCYLASNRQITEVVTPRLMAFSK
jgi:4'-phosphopantetheinyl transferase